MDRSARSGPITAVSTLDDRFFQAWKTRSAPTPPSTFLASARRWTPARPCNSRPSPIQATDTRAPWDHPLDTQPTLQPTAAPDLNPWYLDSPPPSIHALAAFPTSFFMLPSPVKTAATLEYRPKEAAAEPTTCSRPNTTTRQTARPRRINTVPSTANTAPRTTITGPAARSAVVA